VKPRDLTPALDVLLDTEHVELGQDFMPQFEPGTVRGPLVEYEDVLQRMSDLQLD
jgi:hypothetical protein